MISRELTETEKQKKEIVIEERKFEEQLECYFIKKHPENGLEPWPLLNNKYQVTSFIGKGGFAEVFKAYDIENFEFVVIKFQNLDKNWPHDVRKTFIKYATRENQVFQTLNHPNIVKYIDTITIDQYSMCTILEYCEGEDLDIRLKKRGKFPEKESKNIIEKVLEVVKYLNERDPKIIHYDLKPGNILFDNFDQVKVTDFGLCKEMNLEQSQMKLTSIGCGTYYYLPPECLVMGDNIMISSKVDVWSIGVIFFCLLYGHKPFGSNLRGKDYKKQSSNIIKEVKFPEKPIVSDKTKNFIRSCLTIDVNDRPDIFQAYQIFMQKD